MSAAERLDAIEALHHEVIRDDSVAEWARLTAEHDAIPALVAALRAVLQPHKPFEVTEPPGLVCDYCDRPWPCYTVRTIESTLGGTP